MNTLKRTINGKKKLISKHNFPVLAVKISSHKGGVTRQRFERKRCSGVSFTSLTMRRLHVSVYPEYSRRDRVFFNIIRTKPRDHHVSVVGFICSTRPLVFQLEQEQ